MIYLNTKELSFRTISKHVTILSIVYQVLLLLNEVKCQRLSQGASDWYMRFHDFEIVKRNVDDPVIHSFNVNSTVAYRYAVTTVNVTIGANSKGTRIFNFGLVIPKNALISDLKLKQRLKNSSNEVVINAQIHKNSNLNSVDGTDDLNEVAKNLIKKDLSELDHLINHKDNHNHQFLSTDLKQFILPVQVNSTYNVSIELTYEYILNRVNDSYHHVISVSPGQIVEDMNFQLNLMDEKQPQDVGIHVPVIGEIWKKGFLSFDRQSRLYKGSVQFKMTEREQFHYFGMHGFTGDILLCFDVKSDVFDVVFDKSHFIHYFSLPSSTDEPSTVDDDVRDLNDASSNENSMKSIPRHVIFMIDKSQSMVGPKMERGLEALQILLSSLNERDFYSIITFTNESQIWKSEMRESNEELVYSIADKEVVEESEAFLLRDIMDNNNSTLVSNLTSAVHAADSLNWNIWELRKVPNNTYTLYLLLTDGRQTEVSQRCLNNPFTTTVPFYIIGLGFDANMNLLSLIADETAGLALNLIEDLETQPQLTSLEKHLNEIVLKNLHFNYDVIPIEGVLDLTNTHSASFDLGSGITIAGRFDMNDSIEIETMAVEVFGQSENGNFFQRQDVTNDKYCRPCSGTIMLCLEPHLYGMCTQFNHSSLNTRLYSSTVMSIEVKGNCSWTLFTQSNFEGSEFVYNSGKYPNISNHERNVVLSLQINENHPVENIVEDNTFIGRIWGYLKIINHIHKAHTKEISKDSIKSMADISERFNFLTPFTTFVFEASRQFMINSTVTYDNLKLLNWPIQDYKKWQLIKTCESPIVCDDRNFHYEPIEEVRNGFTHKCHTNIELFTKPNFEGEMLHSNKSLHQIYHSISSQRMRSIKVYGDDSCCWLVFEKRFFSGRATKLCDDIDLRTRNVGSVKILHTITK